MCLCWEETLCTAPNESFVLDEKSLYTTQVEVVLQHVYKCMHVFVCLTQAKPCLVFLQPVQTPPWIWICQTQQHAAFASPGSLERTTGAPSQVSRHTSTWILTGLCYFLKNGLNWSCWGDCVSKSSLVSFRSPQLRLDSEWMLNSKSYYWRICVNYNPRGYWNLYLWKRL